MEEIIHQTIEDALRINDIDSTDSIDDDNQISPYKPKSPSLVQRFIRKLLLPFALAASGCALTYANPRTYEEVKEVHIMNQLPLSSTVKLTASVEEKILYISAQEETVYSTRITSANHIKTYKTEGISPFALAIDLGLSGFLTYITVDDLTNPPEERSSEKSLAIGGLITAVIIIETAIAVKRFFSDEKISEKTVSPAPAPEPIEVSNDKAIGPIANADVKLSTEAGNRGIIHLGKTDQFGQLSIPVDDIFSPTDFTVESLGRLKSNFYISIERGGKIIKTKIPGEEFARTIMSDEQIAHLHATAANKITIKRPSNTLSSSQQELTLLDYYGYLAARDAPIINKGLEWLFESAERDAAKLAAQGITVRLYLRFVMPYGLVDLPYENVSVKIEPLDNSANYRVVETSREGLIDTGGNILLLLRPGTYRISSPIFKDTQTVTLVPGINNINFEVK